VIYNPMLKEMFVAGKGEGGSQNNLDYFNEMIMKARAIRRAGSAALDLAYVAAGRFDGFWELKLNPWDTMVDGRRGRWGCNRYWGTRLFPGIPGHTGIKWKNP